MEVREMLKEIKVTIYFEMESLTKEIFKGLPDPKFMTRTDDGFTDYYGTLIKSEVVATMSPYTALEILEKAKDTYSMAVLEFKNSKGELVEIRDYGRSITKEDATRLHELETFDYAVPQPWLDEMQELFPDDFPYGHFVWCYDSPNGWGVPFPLTKRGREMLIKYNTKHNVGYPIPE
jgi:hypothetical protein